MSKNFWKKILKYQEKPGWCGPAIAEMILKSAGIKKTQSEIAKDIYKPWWGTNQQILFAYLSKFFKQVNFRHNSNISHIKYHLKKGHIVVVNWWDDLEEDDADGHYCIVADYNKNSKKLTLIDPSTSRKGVWNISLKKFNSRWYDYLDIHGSTWVDGWMLWLNPNSKL
ncbi:hypothetical protein A2686_05160 [Candidatus Woesebacteria bacterium RIFCSPHIGHO2_01_FULL_38_10]|uniref:Peptidase C39-like domain-containing protein n=1 Tax=Candidatus Woesebacteria bacterium RIFCSPLOWO2_01_FULL_39_10b TaxID=1802517 RepID=A0A1F8B831_9BACT|nr:MAG: hypothetical protein A2686_05160 [Candidatus Woesebacteria bacterium RIFCSPHIGHO2_01_FULL_38_10]OGM59508.1 MAG: hypothetical protein A2892_02600 [Candidatus Woesebacteria bacterium RIFCSPLOWO2_01_FULL_39_10b]